MAVIASSWISFRQTPRQTTRPADGLGFSVHLESESCGTIRPIGQVAPTNCWFDPGTKLVFSSSGDGVVAIARETNPNTLTPVQMLKTAPGAHTMAFDPTSHKIYVSAAKYEAVPPTPPPPPAPGAAPARGRGPAMILNSMHVMVFSYQGK